MSAESVSKEKIEIPLKRPYAQLVGGVLLFLGGGLMLIRKASANDRGLIVNGIIRLETDGANIFYMVVGLVSVAFGLFAAFVLFHMARRKNFRVVLEKNSVILPHNQSWRRGEVKIPYANITSIGMPRPGEVALIRIDSDTGPHYVQTRWFPAEWPVSTFSQTLAERWRASKNG